MNDTHLVSHGQGYKMCTLYFFKSGDFRCNLFVYPDGSSEFTGSLTYEIEGQYTEDDARRIVNECLT